MSHRPSTSEQHHREVILAESENVAVHECSCGMIHLQIGAVCLTMQPEELAEVGAIVLRALDQRQVVTRSTSVVN